MDKVYLYYLSFASLKKKKGKKIDEVHLYYHLHHPGKKTGKKMDKVYLYYLSFASLKKRKKVKKLDEVHLYYYKYKYHYHYIYLHYLTCYNGYFEAIFEEAMTNKKILS